MNFETDEALLTGESLPVQKDAEPTFDPDIGPGDRLNVAFSSSTITRGRARGIVFATGMKTEIGSIAAALRAQGKRTRPVKRKPDGSAKPHRYAQAWGLTAGDFIGRFLGVNIGTPLQRKLSKLAILLFGIAVICAIIVLAANSFSNNNEVIIYAVATGLSMIPACLVVVLTITMAAGTKRMVKRHVIVRKLDSLEALGAVTGRLMDGFQSSFHADELLDICSDKTGTLTQGKMVAKKAWIPSKGVYSVGSSTDPFNPTIGALTHDHRPPVKTRNIVVEGDDEAREQSYRELLTENPRLEDYLQVASLANLAHVHDSKEGWKARGDPTEIAIQVFASRFNHNRQRLVNDESWSQIAEFPFDSDIKKMSVIFENNVSKERKVFTKGAVERVVGSCKTVYWTDVSHITEMTESHRNQILENMEALAEQGLRVLAFASKEYLGEKKASGVGMERDSIESELTFQGLIGLYDPPRVESAAAVKQCHKAGISVHMLTGDHPGTASAIAAQVVLYLLTESQSPKM